MVIKRILLLCSYIASCIDVSHAYDISVSGVSSGGFMAVQHHVAFSKEVKTAGIVAGGPYLCENIEVCTRYPELIGIDVLEVATRNSATYGLIDDTFNIHGSDVYIYSGLYDSVVLPGVVRKLSEYYRRFSANVHEVYDIPSEHGWPSDTYGVGCDRLESPFIVRCNFSFSDFMFSPGGVTGGKIIKIRQEGGLGASMGLYAYVFIPDNISRNEIHVSYHGCEQTIGDIGVDYIMHSGLNSKGMIVVYPQAERTLANPYGCWDWWGYTGIYFATRMSSQLNIVMRIVEGLGDVYMKSINFSH